MDERERERERDGENGLWLMRGIDVCICEKVVDGGFNLENEIDFIIKK